MALAIATNTGALMAAASATSVNKDMETSMERLSTGKRINSAKDDAAGVAIASRLTSEIRGTNQAIRNAQDAQGLINTAEGAHKEIETILQRMRELAVQSSNDTNDSTDRNNLQAEMDQLKNEVDRIAGATSWAGQNLLDGATPNADNLASAHTDRAAFSFHVGSGTSSSDSIVAKIGAVSTTALGIGGATSLPTVANVTATTVGNGAATYAAATGTLTLTGTWAAADTLALNINGTSHTLTVSSSDAYADTLAGISAQLSAEIEALSINGVSTTATATGVTFAAGAASAAPTVSITSAGSNAAGTIVHASANNKFTMGGSFSNGDTYSVEVLGQTISITASTTDIYADTIDGIGQQLAEAINAAQDANGTIVAGEVNSGLSAAYDASTNEITLTQTAVIANPTSDVSADNALLVFSSATPGTIEFDDGMTGNFTMTINGVSLTQTAATGTAAGYDMATEEGRGSYLAALINADSESYGVTASSNATGVVTLTAKTGLALAGSATTTSAGSAQLTQSGTTFTVTGSSSDADTFSLDIDGTTVGVTIATDGYSNDARGVASQISQAVKDAGISGLSVTDNGDGTFVLEKTGSLSVTSASSAKLAVEFIDAAITMVNTQRANLGAIANRLDSTVSNLTNVAINLEAGRGRIEDADFAAESTSLAKSQILQQASTAMLAQANASKQSVLSLLQG